SYPAAEAYGAVLAYAEAVRTAGSSDKDEVVKALEGLSVEIPVGRITIRREDHQAIVPAFWGRTVGDNAYRFKTIKPLRMLDGADITPPWTETGCRMAK
ncbi:MAG: ABC transporter substrate-binding protein, partial [Pseudomonadota bacterium]